MTIILTNHPYDTCYLANNMVRLKLPRNIATQIKFKLTPIFFHAFQRMHERK